MIMGGLSIRGRGHPSEKMRICLLIALAASGCQLAPVANPTSRTGLTLSVTSPATTRAEGDAVHSAAEPVGTSTETGTSGVVEAPLLEDVLRTETLSPPEWRFTASLYAWLAGKSGVVESGPVVIPLDDPDESTGMFVYLEGERGRWGFVADLDVFSSTDQSDSPGGTIEVDEDTVIGEVDVTFRPDEDSALQFLAGLRVLDSSQEISFPILPDSESDVTQIDPVLGAQGTWPLSERFSFRLRGDVGGFGLDSDFTYQMFGLFGWEFARSWQLTTGYRILGWEFEVDDVRNDLRLSGVLFGVAATF